MNRGVVCTLIAGGVLLMTACASLNHSGQSSAAQEQTDAVNIHDVSILFPLDAASYTQLLNIDAFISRSDYERFTASLNSHAPGYSLLRLVSVRLDDCFKVQTDSACAPQMRLVFQPIVKITNGVGQPDTLFSDDGALHLFYDLKDIEQLVNVVETIIDARVENCSDASCVENLDRLGIHPALTTQGIHGSFGQALTGIIRQTVARRDVVLSRMAMMEVMPSIPGLSPGCEAGVFTRSNGALLWLFAAFDRKDEQTFAPAKIGGMNSDNVGCQPSPASDGTQLLVASLDVQHDLMGVGGSSFPLPKGKDTLMGKVLPFQPNVDASTIGSMIERIDDPVVHSAATVDCASCHITGAFSHRIGLSNETLVSATRDNNNPGRLGSLRAFGYRAGLLLGTTESNDQIAAVSISQRTLNESRRVVSSLQGLLHRRL